MSSTAATIGRVSPAGRTAPSKAWYWLALAVAVIGIGCAVTWGVLSTLRTHDRAEAMSRTTLPGTCTVGVAAGDTGVVYYEGDGKPSPEAVGLEVVGPDGAAVAVKAYGLRMDYDVAGWVGKPIATFKASVSGDYRVTASQARDGRISAGDNFMRGQVIAIVAALALAALSVLAAVVITAVVAVRRTAAR